MTNSQQRSTDPKSFQDLPQSIGAMSKRFTSGSTIPLHSHKRDQLLYAKSGTMRVQTETETWVVPPDGAIYISAGTDHSVGMQGQVDMRTLYIDASTIGVPPRAMTVIEATPLLRELILQLSEEPIDYDMSGRCGLIAKLIELEIAGAQELSLSVPLPRDARLQNLCRALLNNPSDQRSLEDWSEVVGASPRTLARLFERELAMNFRDWRQRVRFHNALEALSQGAPVSYVAHDNGYRSTSAFSAAFRKVMGAPPSMYSMTSPARRT